MKLRGHSVTSDTSFDFRPRMTLEVVLKKFLKQIKHGSEKLISLSWLDLELLKFEVIQIKERPCWIYLVAILEPYLKAWEAELENWLALTD